MKTGPISIWSPENVRFDPGADWRDPVGTSPYFIHMVPMYGGRKRTDEAGTQNRTTCLTPLEDGEIQAAMVEYDSVRNARENQRTDSRRKTTPIAISISSGVIGISLKVEGKEYLLTLGTQHLLSEPVPIKEAYWTGERPLRHRDCCA